MCCCFFCLSFNYIIWNNLTRLTFGVHWFCVRLLRAMAIVFNVVDYHQKGELDGLIKSAKFVEWKIRETKKKRAYSTRQWMLIAQTWNTHTLRNQMQFATLRDLSKRTKTNDRKQRHVQNHGDEWQPNHSTREFSTVQIFRMCFVPLILPKTELLVWVSVCVCVSVAICNLHVYWTGTIHTGLPYRAGVQVEAFNFLFMQLWLICGICDILFL